MRHSICVPTKNKIKIAARVVRDQLNGGSSDFQNFLHRFLVPQIFLHFIGSIKPVKLKILFNTGNSMKLTEIKVMGDWTDIKLRVGNSDQYSRKYSMDK